VFLCGPHPYATSQDSQDSLVPVPPLDHGKYDELDSIEQSKYARLQGALRQKAIDEDHAYELLLSLLRYCYYSTTATSSAITNS